MCAAREWKQRDEEKGAVTPTTSKKRKMSESKQPRPPLATCHFFYGFHSFGSSIHRIYYSCLSIQLQWHPHEGAQYGPASAAFQIVHRHDGRMFPPQPIQDFHIVVLEASVNQALRRVEGASRGDEASSHALRPNLGRQLRDQRPGQLSVDWLWPKDEVMFGLGRALLLCVPPIARL